MTEFPFLKNPIPPTARSDRPLYIYEALVEFTKSFGLQYDLPQTFVGAEYYFAVLNPEPKFFHDFMEWYKAQKMERQQKAARTLTVNMADVHFATPPELYCTD